MMIGGASMLPVCPDSVPVMRVISGSLRGRSFDTIPGTDVRPTSDRVREALFNALFSMRALDETTVVDAFAGSGALGLEALSRGAAKVTFMDSNGRSVQCVEANIGLLDLGDRSTVQRGDALTLLKRHRPVDLMFADPPYGFDQWQELADVCPADLLVAESGDPLESLDGWTPLRAKRYGRSHITSLERDQDTQGSNA
jgi:16S rRNA (guanine966-N2)-methyltransferase